MNAFIVTTTLLLAASFCMGGTAIAQDKPLFAGAELLDSCAVDLPLTYAKKDKERYVQAARYLEDQELVYLVHNKKENKALYTRVFVVVSTSKDSSEFVYLESAADHVPTGGTKEAVFPKFKASSERFYNADCFDRKLAAHEALRTVITER